VLDQTTRAAILRLRLEGHGTRSIASALGISRNAVRQVLRAGTTEVPRLERTELGEPHRAEITALYVECKGNLVRVHEKLQDAGATLSYQALTAFCRRHGIGREPVKPAGQYHFGPGEEMQHDTSPHDAKIAGKLRRVQTASLVLCYSRMIFIQCFPSFTRFACKVFLTDALRYFGGAARRCMIDNTHVVVLHGTGKDMVPVPEMAAFADRYGFAFAAHEKGDANRSARVERPFDFIENNFLAGREFRDVDDLNAQALAWCDKVNGTHRRHLHASPRELFAAERPHLHPLPIWAPDVYLLHHRIVDVEGYVSVNGQRYSAPWQLIGRQVEVRETKAEIQIFEGPRLVGTHKKAQDLGQGRATLPEHRPPRGQGGTPSAPAAEERQLLEMAPEIAGYVAALKQRAAGRGTVALRRLQRLLREYPRRPVIEAVRAAETYGLFDLERLERMVLRGIARDFFPPGGGDSGEGHDDE
jgi:transposase